MSSTNVVKKATVSAGTVLSRLANGTFTASLIDIARPCSVSPAVIIDKELEHYENIRPVCQGICSIFAGYYLIAFTLVGQVTNIRTMQVIDQLNPDRSAHKLATFYASESYVESTLSAAVEADDNKQRDALYADDSLAVGKLLYVNVATGAGVSATDAMAATLKGVGGGDTNDSADAKKGISIPILVKITPTFTTPETISHIMEMGSGRNTFKERFYMARAGQISWINDFLLDKDLLKKYQKTLIEDKSGVLRAMAERSRGNRMAGMISNKMSLADASNIWVISRETERRINREISGRLSDYKTRERIFDKTGMMFLVIVDTKFEDITIYYRGKEEATNEQIRNLARKEKGNGGDVTEIFEAFLKSNVPSL